MKKELCNHCGKDITCTAKHKITSELVNENGSMTLGAVITSDQYFTGELCDDCFKSFKEFMGIKELVGEDDE
jgi:hypothetical protein